MNKWPCGWKHAVGKLWMGEGTRNIPCWAEQGEVLGPG